jgi:hypothetical protein
MQAQAHAGPGALIAGWSIRKRPKSNTPRLLHDWRRHDDEALVKSVAGCFCVCLCEALRN